MSDNATCRGLITGAVLAGGRARRMGGEDKGLVQLGGRTMIEYALDALKQQTSEILINANRNLDRYRHYGWPGGEDKVGDFSGPLAGMASVLAHATTPYVLMVPCDSPMLPRDLARRLYLALVRTNAQITVAHDGERMQPVFALLQRKLLSSMEEYLAEGGRKIDRWYATHRLHSVDFSDKPEAFVNVNTPEEREELGQKLLDADQQQS